MHCHCSTICKSTICISLSLWCRFENTREDEIKEGFEILASSRKVPFHQAIFLINSTTQALVYFAQLVGVMGLNRSPTFELTVTVT